MSNPTFNERIDEILKGSYDLHVHAAPDSRRERRLDALDTARWAHEAEMAGFVLKSHDYPTAPLAQTLNRVYPGLTVAGAIVLNRAVGGLNHDAVRASADLGARVVWMPTFDADLYSSQRGTGPGVRLTDSGGRLTREVHDILDIVADRDMLLASGHVSPSEASQLFSEAKARGVQRIIATHPAGVAMIEEQQQMAATGAYVEYTFLACMPSVATYTPREMAASLRTIGVERCVVTTDFGQAANPPAAEGMRMAIATLLEVGLTPEEVETLVKKNPLQLVGVDG